MTLIDNLKDLLAKDVKDVEDETTDNFLTKIATIFSSHIPADFETLINEMLIMAKNEADTTIERIVKLPISDTPITTMPIEPINLLIIPVKETLPVKGVTILEVEPTKDILTGEIDLTTVSGDTLITKSTVTTGRELFKTGSPQVLDTEAIEKRIKGYKVLHVALTITMATVSIAVEVLTLGQMDKVIENLLVLYNLLPASTVYNSVQGQDLEASLLRPYRYLSESANKTQIPSPSDLITFLTKEQLGSTPEESMTIFKRFMGFHGFDDYWSNAYWGAHWILPATSQLYDMLGRGLITNDELKKQLIINDIKPEWIPYLTELAFVLPNKTETRMIQRTRKMSKAKLDKIIANARIQEDYKDDYRFWLENQELATLNTSEVRQNRDLFVKGYIDETDFRALLEVSIYSEAEINVIVATDISKKVEKINDIRLRTLLLERRKNTINDNEFFLAGGKFIKDEQLLEVYLEQEKARLGLIVDIELGSPLEGEEGA